jgi:hypothetical protein
MHAALRGAQRYDEAIHVFKIMLSKLNTVPEALIRGKLQISRASTSTRILLILVLQSCVNIMSKQKMPFEELSSAWNSKTLRFVYLTLLRVYCVIEGRR